MKNLKVKNYVEILLATMSVNELPDFHREIVIVAPESKLRIGVLFGQGSLNLYAYSFFKNEEIRSIIKRGRNGAIELILNEEISLPFL